MPQGISGPGASGNVNGPASSTDNAVTRWDGTTGTIIQDSGAILNDNGDLQINSVANAADAFTVIDSAAQEIVSVSTLQPAVSGNVPTYSFYVYGNNPTVGSGALVTAMQVRIKMGDEGAGGGTQSGRVRGVDSLVVYQDDIIHSGTASNQIRSFNASVAWNSTGTCTEMIGINNLMLCGGGVGVTTGLIDLAVGQNTGFGYNNNDAGSITDGIGVRFATPQNIDATHTVTNSYGGYFEDMGGTGVTNSWGIYMDSQTAGGYAIQTNSGDIEFGDGVFIDGSEDKIQLHVQGNATQTSDILTLEQSDGTDVLTVSNTGETNVITPTNSGSAFVLTDEDSQNILTISTLRLDLSGSGRAFDLAINNNNPIGGTGRNITGMRNRIRLGDPGGGGGTQSGRVRGVDSLLTFFDDVIHTGTDGNQIRAFNASVAWASTGTCTEMVGTQNFIAASGGAYQAITTGLVDIQMGNRSRCGYNTGGSDAGSITDAMCVVCETPKATTATHTITNSYGVKIEDMGDSSVGVTNSWGIKIDDQSGFAIETGVGTHVLGDDVTIGAGAAGVDYKLTFDGETNDGVLTWMEDEDYFRFEDDVVFNTGAGLCYGEIYAADVNTTITISVTGKANKVQITAFSVNGQSNNMTPDHTNDHITVDVAGVYLCNVSMHIESVGGGGVDNYGFSVYKNNGATEFANLHGQRDLAGGGGDEGSVSLSGLISLSVNDTIEVWIWNNTNADDIIVDDINLCLTQIGG